MRAVSGNKVEAPIANVFECGLIPRDLPQISTCKGKCDENTVSAFAVASDWSHFYGGFRTGRLCEFEPQCDFFSIPHLCLGTTTEPQPDRQFISGAGSENPDRDADAEQGPQVSSRVRESRFDRGRQRRDEDADLLQRLGHARNWRWNGRDHSAAEFDRHFDRGYLRRESETTGVARRCARHVERKELAEKYAAGGQSGRQDVQKISIITITNFRPVTDCHF